MKLAEALKLRADLNTRMSRLRNRLVVNSKVQEGDSPSEDPEELLAELEEVSGQLEELGRRRREFEAVTGSMSEGLILLDAEGRVLSINPAARKLFGAGEDCVIFKRGEIIKKIPSSQAEEVFVQEIERLIND